MGGGIKGKHGVVKVPLIFIKTVVHENRYHHRVQRDTACEEKYTFFTLLFTNE